MNVHVVNEMLLYDSAPRACGAVSGWGIRFLFVRPRKKASESPGFGFVQCLEFRRPKCSLRNIWCMLINNGCMSVK